MYFYRFQQGLRYGLSYILLKKLATLKFPQFVINWLGHFLTDRTQSVGQSASLQVTRSFVQGSGIGPYAFLVMIADLQPSHPDICYSTYADDLSAVIPAAISHLAVNEFRHINDWSATNKLLINLSKTKEMIICRPGNRAKPTFPEPITGIEQIHTIKLLGVTFSDNLSFAPHIDSTLCSVSQRFCLLKQLEIRDLNQAALDIVFHSLVLNQLTYASQSFSGYLIEQHIDRLQAILNKAKNRDLSLFYITYVISSKTRIIEFFRQISSNPQHLLNTILSPVRSSTFGTRDRGNPYEMPRCKYNLRKQSSVNRCLFKYI